MGLCDLFSWYCGLPLFVLAVCPIAWGFFFVWFSVLGLFLAGLFLECRSGGSLSWCAGFVLLSVMFHVRSAIFSQVEILVLLKKTSKGVLFGGRFGVVSMVVYLGVGLSPRTGALGYNFD